MKKLIALVSGLAVFMVSSISVMAAFTDDGGNSYYAKSAVFLQDEGIVEGYGDGSFGYELKVNRAEMLKILIGAAGTDVPAEYDNHVCFDDVEAGLWYTRYICYAKEKGWVEGYSDNTFKPQQNIVTAEAVKILLQAFGEDYEETAIWYKGPIEKASELNVIPIEVNKFGHIYTRSHMANMAVRMMKVKSGELEEWLDAFHKYRWTYDMMEREDEFIHHVSSSVDEGIDGSGMVFKGNFEIDYFVLSDCGGANCFIEKFDVCDPMNAIFSMSGVMSYAYEILGTNDDGLCEVNQYFEVSPNPAYNGAEMVCVYDYSLGFDDAAAGLVASDCTGLLADIMYNGLEIDCQEDAYVCSDGTTVSREGALCEFPVCPNEEID